MNQNRRIPLTVATLAFIAFWFILGVSAEASERKVTQVNGTEKVYRIVLQVMVDGLADKIIAITTTGEVYVYDQTHIATDITVWRFLESAEDLGIVYELPVQTPCGVRK